ncbi:MAG: HipA family kinase [Bryobacteraceae bacterium]
MPLNACRHVRKMRGGAQSHLIEAGDGRFYVVKFRNNPQHRRILINEIVSSVFLRYLRLSAPEAMVISVSEDFLRENPDVSLQLGTRRVPVEPGWHFGSQYPGDPERVAVYDFIPDMLLAQVANLREFPGMLAFDKWVANADGRQSVFFRGRVREWPERTPVPRPAMLAWMIDHGFAFNGPHWDLPDAPLYGLYHRAVVYESVRGLDDFQPWLDRIVHFPVEIFDEAYRRIPVEWLEGEEGALEALFEKLLKRRARVPDLIADCRAAKPAWFPGWK